MKYAALVWIASLSAVAVGCKEVPRDTASNEQMTLAQRCNKDNAQDDPECKDTNAGSLAPAQPAQPPAPKAPAPTKINVAK